MNTMEFKAVATLKTFSNEKGELIEYIDIKADVDGIDIKLLLSDSTSKSIFKNKLKEN